MTDNISKDYFTYVVANGYTLRFFTTVRREVKFTVLKEKIKLVA